MSLVNLYQKRLSIASRIRGMLYQVFVLGKKYTKLNVCSNVQNWGEVTFGANVYIGKNVKIYKKNFIGNNVYLGDNVELRCNAGNVVRIGNKCTINRGSLIMGQVDIGNNCLIAPNCIVVGSNHNFSDSTKPINQQGISSKGLVLKDNVWLGAQVAVLDGVTIGENSIIGAGSVVTKDIPPNSIAVGNPCKVVKTRID
jgi:acetyltransferase-like isoleucine patch superfamily enzyme